MQISRWRTVIPPHIELESHWRCSGCWWVDRACQLWITIGVSILLLLVAVGCTNTAVATPTPITLTIAGSTGMHPVLRALTAEFHRQHPNVFFGLRGGGATLGEEQVADGRIDLAASTIAPDASPLATPTSPLIRIPVGIDGLAIVTHGFKSGLNLTQTELRTLFGGQIIDWSEFAGSPAEVVLISREDRSGARILFESKIMQDSRVSLTAVVMPTSQDVVDYIRSNPHAIGYVSRSYLTRQIQQQSAVPATGENERSSTLSTDQLYVVPVDGYLPTSEHMRAQDYPLMTPIYLLTQQEPQTWVSEFIEFVLSPAGQAIVARYHLPVR